MTTTIDEPGTTRTILTYVAMTANYWGRGMTATGPFRDQATYGAASKSVVVRSEHVWQDGDWIAARNAGTLEGHGPADLIVYEVHLKGISQSAASNRWGVERSQQDPERLFLRFYGSSFIAGPTGELLAEAAEEGDAVLLATVDLAECAERRDGWGVFRDRRPELYGALRTHDGEHEAP